MRIFPRAVAAAILLFGAASPSIAEEGAEASSISYDIVIVGVDIGDAVLSYAAEPEDAGAPDYRIGFDMDFRFLFWSGGATGVSMGQAEEGRVTPASYDVNFDGASDPVAIRTSFDDAGPQEWSITPPPDDKYLVNRIPLAKADLKGALDPLSALFIRADDAVSACSRTLPIFTGGTRLDLVLSPGAETAPGVFGCAVRYVPVSGHRADSESVARLVKTGPSLSIFEAAPGLWAPHEVGLPTSLGTLAITRAAAAEVN